MDICFLCADGSGAAPGASQYLKTQGFPLLVGDPEWGLIPSNSEILPRHWVQEHKCAWGGEGQRAWQIPKSMCDPKGLRIHESGADRKRERSSPPGCLRLQNTTPQPHLSQVRVPEGPFGLSVCDDDLHSRENLEGEPHPRQRQRKTPDSVTLEMTALRNRPRRRGMHT